MSTFKRIHYMFGGEGGVDEVGLGLNRKTLSDFFQNEMNEKIDKVYCTGTVRVSPSPLTSLSLGSGYPTRGLLFLLIKICRAPPRLFCLVTKHDCGVRISLVNQSSLVYSPPHITKNTHKGVFCYVRRLWCEVGTIVSM